jgi:hypothetical protein
VPFWLQPEKYYVGAAWYQRDMEIPREWQGKRVVLTLERPHWETRVWVDGKQVGSNNSLSTPHEYDLGAALAPGNHQLTMRVDNGLVVDIGVNSHCVTDHTQGNWNGIVGDISLRVMPLVWIEEVRVYPNVAKKSVRVVVVATNATQQRFEGKLSLFFERDGKATRLPVSQNFNAPAASLTTDEETALAPDAPLWDEFTPGRGQTGDLSREGLILGGRYRGQRLRRPCWAILLLPPSVRRLAEPATPEDRAVAFLSIRFPVARHGCG